MSDIEKPTPPQPHEIRAFCALHFLSQPELADRLGVDKSAVERWVGGKRTPPAFLALALRTIESDLKRTPLVLQNTSWGKKQKRFDIDELRPGLRVGDASNKYAHGEILRVAAVGGRVLVRWTAHDGSIHETKRMASGLKRLPPE